MPPFGGQMPPFGGASRTIDRRSDTHGARTGPDASAKHGASAVQTQGIALTTHRACGPRTPAGSVLPIRPLPVPIPSYGRDSRCPKAPGPASLPAALLSAPLWGASTGGA